MDILTKKCKECEEELNIANFYKSRTGKDGHMTKCKGCSHQIKKVPKDYLELCRIKFNDINKKNALINKYENQLSIKMMTIDKLLEEINATLLKLKIQCNNSIK